MGKPQPKYGWHGEEPVIETYEVRPPDPWRGPQGHPELVPDVHMLWVPDEKTTSQFDSAGERVFIDPYPAPIQKIPNDLVSQLRGGPITSPWIERAHVALAEEPTARRAMCGLERGMHGDTVLVP